MTLEQHLYEFAIIRLVPRVEREEFVNVGIILFCKRQKFLRVLVHVDSARISTLAGTDDIAPFLQAVTAFEHIANGNKNCGPIAQLEISERFRWLTAVRSSSVQTSRPHPGLSTHLEKTAEALLQEMVL